MRTVRTKLVALVLACVAPAVLGAVLRSRQVERELLGQAERRVNATNRRFGAELDEYQANAKLAVTLTSIQRVWNLASRLEGMTKELQCDVILSEDLYRQVEADVRAEPLQRIKVKGRDQDVMVYRLVGLRNDAGA